MTTAPCACLASAPVSSDRVFPPISNSFFVAMISFGARATHHFALLIFPRWPNDGIRPEGRNARGGLAPAPKGDRRLLTNAELVDDRAVALHVHLLEVVEEAAAPSDELQKAAAGVVVLRVRLEVLGEVGNSVREECDLHFWRSGIGVMHPILVDETRLLFPVGRQNPVLLNRLNHCLDTRVLLKRVTITAGGGKINPAGVVQSPGCPPPVNWPSRFP